MKVVQFDSFGGPEVLRLADQATPRPKADEVLVQVAACAVNHLDLDIRAGRSRYPIAFPHVLGRESVGVVAEVGPECRRWREGDRVMVRAHYSCGTCGPCMAGEDNHCLNGRLPGVHVPGGYSEYLVAPGRCLTPIPAGLSWEDAAAAQVAFGTAWHVLVGMTRVCPGDRVLVTGATGGVGVAVVQLANLCGARVMAAAGSSGRLDRLAELCHVERVDYTTENLADRARDWTDGKGVDLVVDTAGGPYFAAAMSALGVNGRLIVVGGHAGEKVELDLVDLFRSQISVVGSRRVTSAELEQVLGLISDGSLRPVVGRVEELDGARLLHESIENRTNFGRLVLRPSDVRTN
ncbi:alcohol dehydrogenase catalytic domain-containing protein [Actinophytocola sp.]|uniref:alcohol dehydrogenase catalytic domain-containing protein n=1 Tax=Actinophytocola sp. TaxID=1872138 RepID=UPI003D6AC03F